jgi:hypothetical protein
MGDEERRQAIGELADTLAADGVTLALAGDGLGLRLDWPGSRGMTIRTKRIRAGGDWELWFVEPPGHQLSQTRDVNGAARIVRDLATG